MLNHDKRKGRGLNLPHFEGKRMKKKKTAEEADVSMTLDMTIQGEKSFEFPISAFTNHHKLSGLKQKCKYILSVLETRSLKWVLWR